MSPRTAAEPTILIAAEESPSGWLRLDGCLEILQAEAAGEVRPALDRLEAGVDAGLYGAGFLTYEAAPALDAKLTTRTPGDLPLAWFGLFREARPAASPHAAWHGSLEPLDWRPSVSPAGYEGALRLLRQLIERGETYQVNYTFRLSAPFGGEPRALFSALVAAQPARYSTYLDLGRHVIASVSPELFFSLEGSRVLCRPMKGTAARGIDLASDRRQIAWLAASEKNRAENLMIVDMVRNDLGRIARPGSVETTELFAVEPYPTVLQMTSTVEAETEAPIVDVLAALFPSASITGAPKRRTMELIARLEDRPRGVYTGAIAYLAPGRSARLSVAIRTLHLDRLTGLAEYGTGGGITWDSDSGAERQEAIAKARVLLGEPHPFDLFETLLWTRADGYFLLERHLDRLLDSAAYFDREIDRSALRRALEALAEELTEESYRVRLVLERNGGLDLEAQPLDHDGFRAAPSPTDVPAAAGRRSVWRVALARRPVDRRDLRLRHKTTDRRPYDEALEACPGVDDVLLWNADGEVTEATVANVVYRFDGRLWTPPVSSGLLSGTLRQELLERRQIDERVLETTELPSVGIYLINSVRGWIPADLVDRSTSRSAC